MTPYRLSKAKEGVVKLTHPIVSIESFNTRQIHQESRRQQQRRVCYQTVDRAEVTVTDMLRR